VFVVYALGACPTIYVGDSGELVAAVHVLGIPHPSGYPLYVLVGKLWTLIVPIGTIAYRMSLFSAACAALTCGVLYFLARRLGLGPLAASVGTLLFAFSPSWWSQANIQRVYALNALFVALASTAALSWHRSERRSHLVLAFFLCGLGASNHTFMAVCAVAIVLFALIHRPALFRQPRWMVESALAFAAGLLPYLYLPLRSRFDPRLDWGNPETVSGFMDVVFRRDFWGRKWLEGPADFWPIGIDYAASLGSELLWLGSLLAGVGFAIGWRRRWPVLLPLIIMAGNVAAMALHGSRTDIFTWHRYYIPSYLMAGLLVAMGCQVLAERRWRARRVLLVLPLVALLSGFAAHDRSRYHIAEDFSRTLLGTLPPGAHLSASDDNILFVLIYLHLVEGLRPDLDLILQGVGGADLPALRFDPDTDPLFMTHHPNWSIRGLEILPTGLAFRTIRAGAPLPEPIIPKTELEGEHDPRVPKDYLTQNLIGHFHYMLGITFETRAWARAAREFDAAGRAAPHNDVLFYNLGLIHERNGLLPEALEAFERSHAANPRRIASKNDVRAADRVAELKAEVERADALERDAASRLGPGLTPGSAAYHRALARVLDTRGQPLLARGHTLRAQRIDSREPEFSPMTAP
jgi:tetratricopeptide (TPR) repeat protein